MEHAAQLAKTNNQYEATFNWKAPASGTGTVTFYGVINAVNNNGQQVGDRPSAPFNIALTEIPTASVNNVQQGISIEAFPNPITTKLDLRTNNLEKGNYNLSAYDMNGKKVLNTTVPINEAAQGTSINTADWACGIYHIQLSKGGMKQTIVVMKK